MIEKKDTNLTLWQFLEQGILADHNRHDALVYFGRRISRKTLIEQVETWARVILGMGLRPGIPFSSLYV